MKKVILGCIIACLLALTGYGAYFIATAPREIEIHPDDISSGETSKVKKELTALPVPKNQADILENVSSAFSMNKNTVGWINIPDTDINNPVMQGDDNDFYLRRDENGEYDVYGCYFLDYECSLGRREDFKPNTIIYGHSELTDDPDGKRFAQLYRFLDDEFAAENKTIYLNTLDESFEFEVISIFYTNLDFKYNLVNITEEEALEIEQKAIELSERDYGITPALGDKLLTLSTCTVKFQNAENHRFVVMGRLKD